MSRSQEEILADYKQQLQDLIGRKPKPNPNHYPIINKWNYKYIYRPHRQEIFETLEKAMDELLEPVMEDIIKKHLSSLDLNFGEALSSPDVIFGNNCSFTGFYKEETMKKHWDNIINGEEKRSYGTFRPSEELRLQGIGKSN